MVLMVVLEWSKNFVFHLNKHTLWTHKHIFCIVKQRNLQILQYSQNNHINSTKLLTYRNDRRTVCFFCFFLRIPHNTDKPLRVVMIAGASTGQGPLILWDSQVTSACKTDCGPDLRLCFGLCNKQDVPYAQAVKLHTLVFCSVESEAHWKKSVQNSFSKFYLTVRFY